MFAIIYLGFNQVCYAWGFINKFYYENLTKNIQKITYSLMIIKNKVNTKDIKIFDNW